MIRPGGARKVFQMPVLVMFRRKSNSRYFPDFRSTKRASPQTRSNNNFGFFFLLAFGVFNVSLVVLGFPEPTHHRKPKLSSLCSTLLNSKRRRKNKKIKNNREREREGKGREEKTKRKWRKTVFFFLLHFFSFLFFL